MLGARFRSHTARKWKTIKMTAIKMEANNMGRVEIRRCVDRDEVFEEFCRLIRQDQKLAEGKEEKDALDQAIIRLQNILY